jgi:hypothetical protein
MVVTPHPPDTPKKDSFERQKPVPEAAHSAKEAISPPEKKGIPTTTAILGGLGLFATGATTAYIASRTGLQKLTNTASNTIKEVLPKELEAVFTTLGLKADAEVSELLPAIETLTTKHSDTLDALQTKLHETETTLLEEKENHIKTLESITKFQELFESLEEKIATLSKQTTADTELLSNIVDNHKTFNLSKAVPEIQTCIQNNNTNDAYIRLLWLHEKIREKRWIKELEQMEQQNAKLAEQISNETTALFNDAEISAFLSKIFNSSEAEQAKLLEKATPEEKEFLNRTVRLAQIENSFETNQKTAALLKAQIIESHTNRESRKTEMINILQLSPNPADINAQIVNLKQKSYLTNEEQHRLTMLEIIRNPQEILNNLNQLLPAQHENN